VLCCVVFLCCGVCAVQAGASGSRSGTHSAAQPTHSTQSQNALHVHYCCCAHHSQLIHSLWFVASLRQKQDELSRRRTRLARRQLARVVAVQALHATQKAHTARAIVALEHETQSAAVANVHAHRQHMAQRRDNLAQAQAATLQHKRHSAAQQTAALRASELWRAEAAEREVARKAHSHEQRRREQYEAALRREQQRLYDLARVEDERRMKALAEKTKAAAVRSELQALEAAQHQLSAQLYHTQTQQKQAYVDVESTLLPSVAQKQLGSALASSASDPQQVVVVHTLPLLPLHTLTAPEQLALTATSLPPQPTILSTPSARELASSARRLMSPSAASASAAGGVTPTAAALIMSPSAAARAAASLKTAWK
jgi:hypothetical protein